MMKKKVAIIGGGFAGCATMVILKEEGIESICFEKTDRMGGTWNYREESIVGVPSIMPTTIINHSKEMGALSNFPPNKNYNNYMKHNELLEYFLEYLAKYDVSKNIQYNSEVIEVKRASSYEDTGCWTVTIKNTLTGIVTSGTYDGVTICVGNINIPKWPQPYPNQEKFKGQILHTHGLKKVAPYENKTVVVVGMGCSALDAAVEISNVARKVYLSTRSGAYVFNRVGPQGYPIDYVMLRRYNTMWFDLLPTRFISWYLKTFIINPGFNSNHFAIKPKHHLLSKDPVVNDHIGSKLLSGSVVQVGDIREFTENGVIFQGDPEVIEVDTVVMATGYINEIPFLETDIKIRKDSELYLYKNMWPPDLKHPTLAFIGYFVPFGPGFPIGEMQCRYFSFIMSGKGKLPSTQHMLKSLERKREKNSKRYVTSGNLLRVDFVQYMDELASLMGCKPNFLKIFFTDPKLYYNLLFGPSLSYQYRLTGPHSWNGARQAIMTCKERVHWPLIKRRMEQK